MTINFDHKNLSVDYTGYDPPPMFSNSRYHHFEHSLYVFPVGRVVNTIQSLNNGTFYYFVVEFGFEQKKYVCVIRKFI